MNGLDGVLAPDGVLGTEFLSKPYTLDVLAERYDFPVPDGMVDLEFEQIWGQLAQEAGEQGIAGAKILRLRRSR